MFTTLISCADLAKHMANPEYLIVDCRFELTNAAAGESAYREAHLPGAIYAHLDRDLSGARSDVTGRHPLPSPEKFAATLGEWGVTAETQVIAYDADIGVYASRLWWMLRWVGHTKVAVLEGGLNAWRTAGLPVSQSTRQRAPTTFTAHADRTAWLDTTELAQRVRDPQWRVLDARAPQRYAGEVEPLDAVAGHVPGARNHPLTSNVGAQGLLPPEELRALFAKSQEGVSDDHTVVMCGSGVSACHVLLAMEVAGKHGARLYPGSWSEWIKDASRGVAKGVDR